MEWYSCHSFTCHSFKVANRVECAKVSPFLQLKTTFQPLFPRLTGETGCSLRASSSDPSCFVYGWVFGDGITLIRWFIACWGGGGSAPLLRLIMRINRSGWGKGVWLVVGLMQICDEIIREKFFYLFNWGLNWRAVLGDNITWFFSRMLSTCKKFYLQKWMTLNWIKI